MLFGGQLQNVVLKNFLDMFDPKAFCKLSTDFDKNSKVSPVLQNPIQTDTKQLT